MPEIGTYGLMSEDGKQGDAGWPKPLRPSSTLREAPRLSAFTALSATGMSLPTRRQPVGWQWASRSPPCSRRKTSKGSLKASRPAPLTRSPPGLPGPRGVGCGHRARISACSRMKSWTPPGSLVVRAAAGCCAVHTCFERRTGPEQRRPPSRDGAFSGLRVAAGAAARSCRARWISA